MFDADDEMRLLAIQWGTPVLDSEGNPLGRVEKVYRNADYGVPPPEAAPSVIEPYIEVQSDEGRFWVPVSKVSEVRPGQVVLNLLKRHVHEMGFDQEPDFLDQA